MAVSQQGMQQAVQGESTGRGSVTDAASEHGTRLARLFEHAPSLLAWLEGGDHRVAMANAAWQGLVGHRPLQGLPVAQALPELFGPRELALLDEVSASAAPRSLRGVRCPTADGERHFDIVFQPMQDARGVVDGIVVDGVDVTDRVRTEAALRDSEARFRSALKAGRMGSWETDQATRLRTWSAEGMALFGLQLADGRGQVGGAADEYVAALHPEDRHLARRFHELADQQDSFAAEYRIVRPDGTILWLAGRGLVVRRGADGRAERLVSIMADTTERKLAELQLAVEKERLAMALAAGQMGAFDFDMLGGRLWWSPQTCELFGLDVASFVPTPEAALALVHPDDRAAFVAVRAEAIDQRQPFVHEFRGCLPDGRTAWFAIRGRTEYTAAGVPRRSFGTVMDITARKQDEQKLRDNDAAKDEFIAILAHELRNPLAPIRNAVQVLQRSPQADPALAWCCAAIDRQSQQMAHLLDDLLDVSQIGRRGLRLQRQLLVLQDVVRRAMETAQPLVDAGRHRLEVALPMPPLWVDGDPSRLEQVVANVLINAAKYTPPGGQITVVLASEGGHAALQVSDNGIGIAATQLPRVFALFGQAAQAASPAPDGQGIGLALARTLVELHGGEISVHSAGLGQGSRVDVQLPLAAPETEAPSTATPSAAPPDNAGLRILIADDMADIAETLSLLLTSMGHEVEVAADGHAALRLAEAWRPQVVVLDLGMPGLDGFEACRAIRSAPWGTGMTLIAQTGWGQPGDRRRTREAGFDHHLVKPVDVEVLCALLPTC